MIVYVVTQNKLYKGLGGVHGVFSTRQLAQEYVDQCSHIERRVIFERELDKLVLDKETVVCNNG